MANDKRYSREDNSERNSQKAKIILIIAIVVMLMLLFGC